MLRTLTGIGTVVGVAGDPTAVTDDAEWVLDPGDVLGRTHGLGSEGIVLIRPDGYVGLRADSADPGLLRRHLVDALRLTEPPAVPSQGCGEPDLVAG